MFEYTFPLPPELTVSNYAKELNLLPTEMRAYLMAEFLHRDWRRRRPTEIVETDSKAVVRRVPRWFPTDDPRFLKHGITKVDIANLGLLQLPLDIFSENLLDARILISLCERELSEGRSFTSDFQNSTAQFLHTLWWKRNYLRLLAENRGELCRDLPQLPTSIREEIIG